ncbi:hypothetical protein HanRHA438_Chr12g0573571 [Helianthus annuus]|nr:hypothetical protein HanRHA438_Chr12g0573571 [Helianthus annuus]
MICIKGNMFLVVYKAGGCGWSLLGALSGHVGFTSAMEPPFNLQGVDGAPIKQN